jgi:hypothetical protein
MNGPFQTARELTATMLPVEFEVLAPPPLLLPVNASTTITRYARRSSLIWRRGLPSNGCWRSTSPSFPGRSSALLRHRLPATYRQKAIEAALRRIDMAGIAPEFEDEADYYTRQSALSWRLDPVATTEIEARLASYGFDQHSINTDVYVQAREVFVLFEGLLNAAQARRLLLIREIEKHRFLA